MYVGAETLHLVTRMGSPLFGAIDHFNSEKEKICSYLEPMDLFLQANTVAEDNQVSVFLSCIGGTMYALEVSFCLSNFAE